jgi:glucuronate isomerase
MKENDHATVASGVFWWLAECCQSYELPFDLMIGVNRRVYEKGVYQGQDLYDQRTSLIQYASLFNAFPSVKFCISVLTSSQNQELASYSWIFPNVYTSGHWWYSNVPTLMERDLKLRLQCVPSTKQIGYYSDAYKLEFILPKYNMYRRVLAKVLAEEYVEGQHWSEERAVALGTELLRDNVVSLFP